MNLDIVTKIASPIVTLLLGAAIRHYAEDRARLVSFIGHISSFKIQDKAGTVIHTHSVIVHNVGRRAAHNVRLAHSVLPPHVTIHPSVQYTIEQNPEGAQEIVIPVLVPKEQVTISYLYFPPLTWNQINSTTKSDEGFAKIITVIPVPPPRKTILFVLWVLIFIGASFVMYWLARIVTLGML